LRRTAIFTTAPTATSPIAAATTSGLYVNGATANVSFGTLTIGTGNSSDTVRVDAGNIVVTNEVLIGHTSNTRWEILQVNGGSFTSLDVTNGIVLSQNNGTTANSSELYLSGGTATAEKIAFGVTTDTVGGTGFLIVSGGTLYLGSGGIAQSNATGYSSTISMLGGTMGTKADWSSGLPIQLSGTSFTFNAADALGTAHNISLRGVLSGGGALNKTGTGTLTLAGTNTYTGATLVSAGNLLVNGRLAGSSAVTIASGGTLGGTGTLGGPATIQSGGTLSPGTAGIGTLTFSNSLSLAAGCTNILEISKSPLTNDIAKVVGALTNGGTLIVTNIGAGTLTNGDSFKLFNAGSYSGAFSKVILPPLPAGLGWNTSALNTSGTLSVVVIAKPYIGSMAISGNGFGFAGTGGVASANFYLLGTTNLAMPVFNWTRLLTNQFDAIGNFNFTNPINTNSPQSFYLLQLP